MDCMSSPDLRPVGADLFNGFEGLMQDLSEADEAMISGGSRSNSGRRKQRQKRRRRRRQRVRNNSNSRT